jgi:hypothetical protein
MFLYHFPIAPLPATLPDEGALLPPHFGLLVLGDSHHGVSRDWYEDGFDQRMNRIRQNRYDLAYVLADVEDNQRPVPRPGAQRGTQYNVELSSGIIAPASIIFWLKRRRNIR